MINEMNNNDLNTFVMDNKAFDLSKDRRNVVVSEDTERVVKLIVSMGEIHNEIYQMVRDFHGDSSVDAKFNEEFSDLFKSINEKLSEYLKNFITQSIMLNENITEDAIRI